MTQKEALARIKINKLLEAAGWRLLDSPEGRANVTVENHLVYDETNQSDLSNGFADYVLWDKNNKPLAVLEAKEEGIPPLHAKDQGRNYANSLGVKWVFLSNGVEHYQWNLEEGNPEVISHFPTQESLETNVRIQRDSSRLIEASVTSDFIVRTQFPNYEMDPRWSREDTRAEMIEAEGLRFLRPYQIAAIEAMQAAISQGKKKFLFEMATGTGKTLTSAAIIKLFITTQNASRVLFLVDRLELERQAGDRDFPKYLKPDLTTLIYKKNKDTWSRAEVVVTTIQSIMMDDKFETIFNPNDFDLIISDEAHRAISGTGESRNVFDYFKGYKLGLTATPKDYLKNLDEKKLNENDPREYERRVLYSTYRTFGCESGEPTFRYSLRDGVGDGYLINPYVIDCRTKVTTQLLSDEGYAVINNSDDESDNEDAVYHAGSFEKTFFSPDTNDQFIQTFFEKALRDPLSQEIGKSLIFTVSQNHAAKITQLLNAHAHRLFPGKYNSDFAVQTTSNVRDAQSFSTRFANNNLNGESRFLPGYKTSKTRVCVTVGMMTTGYDCQDILNICLMRPIFSPQDFVQIKGRGTRKFTFKYQSRIEGQLVKKTEEKISFKLFDFFANCEYFDHTYDYDEVLTPPKQKEQPTPVDPPWDGGLLVDGDPGNYAHTRYAADYMQTINEHQIGVEGMTVDSKLYGLLRETALQQQEKADSLISRCNTLWVTFAQENEIQYEKIPAVRDVFFLAALDERTLDNLAQKQFSQYADQPEIFSKLETLGREWIEKITIFLRQAKESSHAH